MSVSPLTRRSMNVANQSGLREQNQMATASQMNTNMNGVKLVLPTHSSENVNGRLHVGAGHSYGICKMVRQFSPPSEISHMRVTVVPVFVGVSRTQPVSTSYRFGLLEQSNR